MAAAGPAATRLAVDDPWEWQDGVVRSGPPPREWVLRRRTMQRNRAQAARALQRSRRALSAARERFAGAIDAVVAAHRASGGAWWELIRPGRPGRAARRPVEARRDEARARALRAQALLHNAAAEAGAAVRAAHEAAEELDEELYVEAFGDVIARIRHDLVSNFTMLCCDDAELGAAARRCWGESHGEVNRPPRRNLRYAPR